MSVEEYWKWIHDNVQQYVYDGPVMVSTGVDSRDGNQAMQKPQGWGFPAEDTKKLNANASNDEVFALAA